MTELVYDTQTRDLMNLARERQLKAVLSVVQLARDPAQAFAIYMAAATAAFGGAAGAYAAWQGLEVAAEPLALAEDIIALMRAVKA